MKQFSLEEFLKDPSKKVITRDGKLVRIICTDAKRDYPIIALIEEDSKEYLRSYQPDGKLCKDMNRDSDLFFYTEKKVGWVNLYRTERGMMVFGYVCETKEKALNELKDKCNSSKLIDTIKIQWEE